MDRLQSRYQKSVGPPCLFLFQLYPLVCSLIALLNEDVIKSINKSIETVICCDTINHYFTMAN